MRPGHSYSLRISASVLRAAACMNRTSAPSSPSLRSARSWRWLQALAETIRTDYPGARLRVPYDDLRHSIPGGIMGSRLHALPVSLT